MRSIAEYLSAHPLDDPAYAVVHIAAHRIREHAARHFGGRLLEIGCGSKRKSLLVGDLVREHVGLDHQGSLHDQSEIDVFATAYEIPAADGCYDCILSTAVLEHLEEPQHALCEAFRVLRPGGYALYTLPLFWHVHEEPRDFFRYTSHGARHLFERAGFEVVAIEALSGFWTTFGAELNYYLQRFAQGALRPLVRAVVALSNLVLPRLDRGFLRAEQFTWAYVVVVRKP